MITEEEIKRLIAYKRPIDMTPEEKKCVKEYEKKVNQEAELARIATLREKDRILAPQNLQNKWKLRWSVVKIFTACS
jgi:hypothetical protein